MSYEGFGFFVWVSALFWVRGAGFVCWAFDLGLLRGFRDDMGLGCKT